MLRNHQAIGFRQSVNNRTQKESPCIIPCFSCTGPILSSFSLILTSSMNDGPFLHCVCDKVGDLCWYVVHF